MIRFEEITNCNVGPVCALSVFPEQADFVAPNAVSLAEAFATRNEGGFAMPFAIYDDAQLIGFVMFGYGTIGDGNDPEIAKDNYVLWRLMLDQAYQGRGYARTILDAAVGYARTAPCGPAACIWLSYEPENVHGRRVYTRYGFRENGEMCGDEIVAVLPL